MNATFEHGNYDAVRADAAVNLPVSVFTSSSLRPPRTHRLRFGARL